MMLIMMSITMSIMMLILMLITMLMMLYTPEHLSLRFVGAGACACVCLSVRRCLCFFVSLFPLFLSAAFCIHVKVFILLDIITLVSSHQKWHSFASLFLKKIELSLPHINDVLIVPPFSHQLKVNRASLISTVLFLLCFPSEKND